MNPPYSPQQQFGPPPLQQNYADIKQNNSMSQPGQNATFNDQNAPPQQVSFQYKGPMGQPNNIGPNSPNPMQSGMSPMMPPGPMPPQASFPGPPQMGQPQRLNGPSMGQPGQLQRQTRSPNAQTQSSPRPMYPGSQIPRLPPRQMGPPPQLNQMGEVDLAPQSKQTPPSLQTMIVTSQFIEPHKDQTEGDLASPRPMGMPPGNVPPTAPKLESNTNLAGPNVNQNNPNANQMGPPQIGAPLRPQMNSNLSQQTQGTLPPTSINSQPSLNNYGTPKQLQSNTQEYSQKPAQYPGMPPPGSAMGMPRMAQPNMGQPPIGQPLMGQPPVSQPLMGQPPMGQPPMGQNLMGQPPMAQNLMGQPPMGQNLMGQPPMGQNPMAQPPMGQPPMGQPPMGQPPMGQPQMGHPAMGQPPMGQPPMGQPPMGQPPMGQPPMGQPHMGQPPMGQPPMGLPSMGHPGMGLSPMGQPAMVQAQMGQPPMGQPPMMQPQMGQPPMGMSPMGQPPMGMSPMGQPPMGQPGMGLNTNYMPPNPMGPSQLTNQMGGMQIGGSQRQYPGTPMKPAMNGENMPHMPPPLTQAQYMNRSQARSPQQNMGYPPMPAQQQMAGGPYPPQPNYQQTQQARRLDPDQMPSPIQVTQDDQRTRSGIFCTNQKGLVPPLVSTTFVTQDQGNASPRFIRSTMYNVPTTSDMMKQTAVPFGLVISPLARTADQEYPPPVVDFGELGPVRCIRCKAYMCPFMQFIDSGRRFQCLFCKATTEVPNEYFQHLDHTGLRVDRFERPELILGTYEFVATKDYCRNNTYPKPPAVIFIIDVSYNNMKSGLVHLLCAEMKDILKNLPIDHGQEKSKMKVGFITYNNTVHFYNIKGTLAQPQMMVVGDTQEMFMPLLDGFLCDVEESAAVIDSLMEQIPTMFSDTRDTEVVLLPAIQAGLEALKASECAGKLLLFHSTLPTAEAPGRLKNRDDRKLLGTEKERTVLVPQNQAYNQLGMDCVGAGCSVDLFIFNNSYIDIATIGQVSRLSGGEVFKYTYFQADIDGKRLISDVITDINRPVAFDTIMRVRTSTGVRPTDFFGHFYMSNTTDMEIAAVDCDKAVAVEIKHDDKLTEEEGVYIQVALLYTSCAGQRRLRVLNLSLKTCSQMADLYRSCELDTIVNFFAKQSVYRLMENNPKAVKDSLVNRCAQILACYRKNCASPSSAGQLILPECMKLLPLYVNCLLKSDALSGSDMTLDDRSFVMQAVTIMDIPTSVVYFYPRLIPLHEIQNTENPEIPNAVRSTSEKMVDNGIYLLENGIHMLIWIGSMANPEWIQHVFGVTTATQVDTERFELPELENNLSITIRNLIEQIQIQRHRCMRLTLVKQRDKLEVVFRHFLVEDRGNDGTSSYVDFLCHMHKEIRQLLS